MKHFDIKDRAQIELLLKDNFSLSQIANIMSRPKSSIWREIQIHKITLKRHTCDCVHFSDCKRDLLKQCLQCGFIDKTCKNCSRAESRCPDHIPDRCKKKSNIGLCNHCTKLKSCPRKREVYDANKAQEMADLELRNSRSGFSFTPEEYKMIDNIVSPLLKQGQSLYHIYQTHKDEIGVSESTVRRMIRSGVLTAKEGDLPRAVKYKRRNYDYKHKKEITLAKLGHLKEDFDAFIKNFPNTAVVQIDTVLSCKGTSTAILTIMFVNEGLQLGYKLTNATAANVVKVFDLIESQIGLDAFRELFPVILTDNGKEFDEFKAIETSFSGKKRTKVFFCHAYRSNEKPHCENNHALIRRILPKKIDFTDITQEEINLMMNNINSYKRKSRDNETPIEKAFQWMDINIISALNLIPIPPDDVILNKSLLQGFYDRTNQNSPKLMEALDKGLNGEEIS